MTANELAHDLEKSIVEPYTSEYLVRQAATMLRQQQAEIEALKAKTLTDEEIENIAENCWKTDEDLQFFDYNKFARAILRKAQEK